MCEMRQAAVHPARYARERQPASPRRARARSGARRTRNTESEPIVSNKWIAVAWPYCAVSVAAGMGQPVRRRRTLAALVASAPAARLDAVDPTRLGLARLALQPGAGLAGRGLSCRILLAALAASLARNARPPRAAPGASRPWRRRPNQCSPNRAKLLAFAQAWPGPSAFPGGGVRGVASSQERRLRRRLGSLAAQLGSARLDLARLHGGLATGDRQAF